MENIKEVASEVAEYTIKRIGEIIASFDRVIEKQKSDDEILIFTVTKEQTVILRTDSAKRLVKAFLNPEISIEEKNRLKDRFERKCQIIFTSNKEELNSLK